MCPSVDKWIKESFVHTYNEILFDLGKNKYGDILLCQISQAGTDIIFTWSQKKKCHHIAEKKMAVLPQAEGEDWTHRKMMVKGNQVSTFSQTGRISVLVLIPNIERRADIIIV